MKHFAFVIAFFLVISAVAAQENETNDTTNQTAPQQPSLICNTNQCDTGCMICSDKNCHDPSFVCKEELKIDKMLPKEFQEGSQQINILIRNTGTVDLKNIYAEITGDGISTTNKIPIQKLVAGDKDYTFVQIAATKPGTIDVIIKLYINNKIAQNFIDTLNVIALPKSQEPQYNATALMENLTALKNSYKLLEQDYQDKKSQGYPVDIITDKMSQTSALITDTQSDLLNGDYRKVQTTLLVIADSLSDIQSQLSSAKKQEETFGDKVRSNLLLWGSLAGAIISLIAVTRLVQSNINKEKILALHQKITSSKSHTKIRKKKHQ